MARCLHSASCCTNGCGWIGSATNRGCLARSGRSHADCAGAVPLSAVRHPRLRSSAALPGIGQLIVRWQPVARRADCRRRAAVAGAAALSRHGAVEIPRPDFVRSLSAACATDLVGWRPGATCRWRRTRPSAGGTGRLMQRPCSALGLLGAVGCWSSGRRSRRWPGCSSRCRCPAAIPPPACGSRSWESGTGAGSRPAKDP